MDWIPLLFIKPGGACISSIPQQKGKDKKLKILVDYFDVSIEYFINEEPEKEVK